MARAAVLVVCSLLCLTSGVQCGSEQDESCRAADDEASLLAVHRRMHKAAESVEPVNVQSSQKKAAESRLAGFSPVALSASQLDWLHIGTYTDEGRTVTGEQFSHVDCGHGHDSPFGCSSCGRRDRCGGECSWAEQVGGQGTCVAKSSQKKAAESAETVKVQSSQKKAAESEGPVKVQSSQKKAAETTHPGITIGTYTDEESAERDIERQALKEERAKRAIERRALKEERAKRAIERKAFNDERAKRAIERKVQAKEKAAESEGPVKVQSSQKKAAESPEPAAEEMIVGPGETANFSGDENLTMKSLVAGAGSTVTFR
ncbi:unnamed protein product [Polarella glacialis]|uniref:Uncharacterized protein n=1 Tax=Polarella glacialis TaxID=89957 RepID=A0A813LUE0_POLGL|nr:unnamed protein product [Polarella glacialis]CAE8743721.1 unnamed protein product [Polarella glacialis]